MMCDTDKARSRRRRRDSCDSGRAGRWRTGGWPRPREAGPVTETGEMLSDTPRRYSFRLWGRRRCRRRRRRQGEPSQRPCPAHQAHAARGGETGMTRGREGRGGRTDKHAGREGGMKGGAPRALHSSSVASRFRSFSISGSVSGSCRDCSTWHRDCSSTRSTSKSSQYNLVSCQFPSTDQRKRSGRNTGETVPEYNFLHAYHSLDGRIGAFGAEYIVTKAVDRHQVKFKLIVTMFVLVEKARSCRQWEQRRKR